MRIKPKNLMAHGIKGRLREAWPMEAFELLAEHRRDIDSCGGWRWIRGWLLSLILWWIDQEPANAEAWMKRYIVIRDLE